MRPRSPQDGWRRSKSTDTVNKASTAATSYFNQTKPKNIVSSTLQFSPNSAQTAFTVTATSWVKTPFLGALDFIIKKNSQVQRAERLQRQLLQMHAVDHHVHG